MATNTGNRQLMVPMFIVGFALLLIWWVWPSGTLHPAAERQPTPRVTIAESKAQEPTALTPHQRRLAALREKREGIVLAMAIEREAVATTLREKGVGGVPEGEEEHMKRLIQEKESIDAAIREEEQEGGSDPEPAPPTVLQTLAHHQLGETFSVGYWTYRCDGVRWSNVLGNGSSEMGHPDAAFAVIYLTMRNDDDSASSMPSITLVDSNAHEYEESPKEVLEKDALNLTAEVAAKASVQGSVIFDVPQGRTYFLKVSGGLMSTQAALIDLKAK